ncbi:hypothetical protein HA402_011135 [Bradysia odoriphaga]|nr:hypothetical protein HA402_011135 [Bradysia odoriphaga]
MSQSAINSLRQYRFKKNVPAISNNENGENKSKEAVFKLAPNRKRIHTAVDSSGDEEPSTAKTDLTVKEKEARLIAVKQALPQCDTMLCQDVLARHNWDVEIAISIVSEKTGKKRRTDSGSHVPDTQSVSQAESSAKNEETSAVNNQAKQLNQAVGASVSNATSAACTPHSVTNSSQSRSGQQNASKKLVKKRRTDSDSNGDSDDETARPKDRVFNSDDDDSDEEHQTFHMTKDRREVFNFINKGSLTELQAVKSCTSKKIDAILEMRPFRDWQHMMQSFQGQKGLSAEVLNHCQDYLGSRNSMVKVMKKCESICRRLESSVAAGGGLFSQPSILNSNFKLADYQLVGLNWLVVMNQEQTNGILADEMGLGKTIQVIAFLAYLKETGKAKYPHLVVVPSSTLDNWDQEFAKWCPSLVVDKYYGSADERRSLRIKYVKTKLEGVDVVLTTYHTVSSTPEERKMFRVTQMHYVIFDEAHMLKNMTTQRYANLYTIKSERRLLLTGTPLQNNLLELISLLCFVMPSLFASKSDDIKTLFRQNKQIKGEDEVSTFEQDQITQAKRIMKPFVLRRLKADVLGSLPPKTDHTIKVPLSASQKEKYKDMVSVHSSENGIVRATNEHSGMSIMMDMRKLANHPLLMRYYYTDEKVLELAKRLSTHPSWKKTTNPQYIFEELAICSDFQLYQMIEKYNIPRMDIPAGLILDSGKFRELDRLLVKLKAEGHRVLIFSQFTMMLDILERYLDIRDHGYLRIDGQTAVTERQDLIDQYMGDSDMFVFLLSTRAGGLGINLTAADTVIIHDIDFNPYNDKQAEDRCHRMGQTRPVTIYRLVSEGTIEEGMLHVAKEKLNLEKEVTNENENSVKEHKCMVRLLTMALGMDEEKADIILSPTKPTKAGADY